MFGITAWILKTQASQSDQAGAMQAVRFDVVVHRCAMTPCSCVLLARAAHGEKHGRDRWPWPARDATPGWERARGHGRGVPASQCRSSGRSNGNAAVALRHRGTAAAAAPARPAALPSKALVGVTPAVDRPRHRTDVPTSPRRLYLRPFRVARAAS